MEHVDVVEALGRVIAGVFDQGVVGPLHIAESPAASRRYAGGLGLGDLRPGPTRHTARAWPRVAADEDRAALIGGVERKEREILPALVRCRGSFACSVTCQPKCQIAVCGDVGGAAATFVNRTSTSFGAASAGEAAPARLRAGRKCSM